MASSKTSFKLKLGQTKDFKTIDEQIELLRSRNLIIKDYNRAYNILERINYYRLSAYSLTFRKNDIFYPNKTIENIYELYLFDNNLRKIIQEFTSYIEVAFKTYISYEHSKIYGPLGYLDFNNFHNKTYHTNFVNRLEADIARSTDIFTDHYKKNYNSVFPLWVAIESTTFGELSKLFKNLKPNDRTKISKTHFGLNRSYIENWLQVAVYARNIAAHHGRFYNRTFKSVPVRLNTTLANKINNTSTFAFVFAIYKLQPTSEFAEKMIKDLQTLFKKHPFALKRYVGFPDDWQNILHQEKNPIFTDQKNNNSFCNKIFKIFNK